MATVNKVKDTGRSIPVAKDLMYKARVKYPGYDDQAALTLYMADQFQNQLTVDLDQNKVINAQKRENEKLKFGLNKLGQELNDIEIDSQNTDRELERLKQLSGKLKPEGEVRQATTKASAEELAKLEKDLEIIKNKPGIDDKKYKELSDKIKELPKLSNDKQVEELRELLAQYKKQKQIDDSSFNDLLKSLEAKERRFVKYITKKSKETTDQAKSSAEEMKKYSDIVHGYKKEIDDFKSFAQSEINDIITAGQKTINNEKNIVINLRGELQQSLNQVHGEMDEISKVLNYIKNSSGYVTHQALNKAQDTSSAEVKAGQQNTDQQNTGSQSTGRQLADLKETQNMNKNQIYLFDDVKLTRQHPDPDFNMWLQKHIEYLVKIFKRNYKNDLARKNPTYGDQQIADAIEDNAEWINNWFKKHDDAPLTNEVVDIFLSGVKVYLWAEPVDTDYLQGQLFNSKVYENILDKLINETLNKER